MSLTFRLSPPQPPLISIRPAVGLASILSRPSRTRRTWRGSERSWPSLSRTTKLLLEQQKRRNGDRETTIVWWLEAAYTHIQYILLTRWRDTDHAGRGTCGAGALSDGELCIEEGNALAPVAIVEVSWHIVACIKKAAKNTRHHRAL